MNSTVRPIFNEKIAEKWNLWVHEQCTNALFTGKSQHLRLLFMHCAAAKFDFSPSSQPIRTHRALFTDPQISLFSNFFIKNGSHGTIYTFKNYFATMFFSFQFSAISKRTLSKHLVPKNFA